MAFLASVASYLFFLYHCFPSYFRLVTMSVIESIESGILSTELREALRTLLSQHDQPYLDLQGSEGLGICISTSFADIRRRVEAEYQEKIDSRPKVPTNYSVGGRRKLPDGKPKYQDAAVQTESMAAHARPGTPRSTVQTESAPEGGSLRRRKGGRTPVSRAICSSSSETDRVRSPRRSHPLRSQGRCLSSDVCWYIKGN
jgi:hypothetical protein